MLLSGVGALCRKELLNLLREPKSAFMIFFPIVIFLTLFVYASTKDVENSSLVIFNQDNGTYSYDLIDDLVNTKVFEETLYVHSEKEFAKKIDTEKAFIGITFPQNFSKNLSQSKRADIQIITDGRRTNASTITYGYISQILMKYQKKISGTVMTNAPDITVRTWYNPNKDPIWFSITNLVCTIIISQAISLVSLSIAREKEQGTFDQLLVSPIKPLGMLVGKVTPSVVISLFMGFCIMFLGNWFYGVPIYGSLLLMLISMIIYVIATVGIGVCISAFANTQQQAMLGAFIIQIPLTAVSGLMSPVEGIENPIMKLFVKCNPVVYGNRLVKGIMLKNSSFQASLESLIPLIIIGIVVLGIAGTVFAKKHRIKIF